MNALTASLVMGLFLVARTPSAAVQGRGAEPEDQEKRALELTQLRLENERLSLENKRLPLETRKLTRESDEWWLTLLPAPAVAFLGVILSVFVAWITARRARWGTFDLAVLEKRLDSYPDLVTAAKYLALYFPESPVTPATCKAAGDALRTCFFGGAGILISKDSRDRYFTLIEALALAANATSALDVPNVDDYGEWVNESMIDRYRKHLDLDDPGRDRKRVRDWKFGAAKEMRADLEDWLRQRKALNEEAVRRIADLFRDFVLLQTLASRLRTALTADIGGRRRPA